MPFDPKAIKWDEPAPGGIDPNSIKWDADAIKWDDAAPDVNALDIGGSMVGQVAQGTGDVAKSIARTSGADQGVLSYATGVLSGLAGDFLTRRSADVRELAGQAASSIAGAIPFVGDDVAEDVYQRTHADTAEMQRSRKENTITGDIFDPKSVSLGTNPTTVGMVTNIGDTVARMAPAIVAARVNPLLGAAAGASQAYEGSRSEEADRIDSLPREEVMAMPRFRELVEEETGMPFEDGFASIGAAQSRIFDAQETDEDKATAAAGARALQRLKDEAGHTAGLWSAPLGLVQGYIFTGKIGGAVASSIRGTSKGVPGAMRAVAGTTAGATIGGFGEATTEVGQKVASAYGATTATGEKGRNLTADTAADAILGFGMGAGTNISKPKPVIDRVFGDAGINAGDVLGDVGEDEGGGPGRPIAPASRGDGSYTFDERGQVIEQGGGLVPVGPSPVPPDSPGYGMGPAGPLETDAANPDFIVDPAGGASAPGDWRSRLAASRARSGGPGMGPAVDGESTMAEPDMAQAAFDSAIESIQATIGRKPTKASLKATATSVAARFGVDPEMLIQRHAKPVKAPVMPDPIGPAAETPIVPTTVTPTTLVPTKVVAPAAPVTNAAPVPVGKMWRNGKGAMAVQTADGTWFTRVKRGTQWQPWQKRKTFDPSGAFGYSPYTPPSGNVRINGKVHAVGERRSEAKQAKAPPDVIDSIIAAGGLNREEMRKHGIDPKLFGTRRGATKWVFPRNGGMTLDALRQRLIDDGYFPPEDPDAPPTISNDDAFEIVQRALNQGERIVSINRAAEEAAHQAAQRADDPQPEGIDDADAELANEYMGRVEADPIAKRLFEQIDNDDEADALALNELVERALAAGVTPQEMRKAYDLHGFDGEPTADPVAARNLWELIRTKESENGTVTRTGQAGSGNGPAPETGRTEAAGDAAPGREADGVQGPTVGRDQPEGDQPAREQTEVERRGNTSRSAVDALPANERDAEIQRLRSANAELQRQLDTDPLTGVLSRAAYERDILSARGVATIDLKQFKGYNTVGGQTGGDLVLKAFAKAMQDAEADGVRAYRPGGDEFAFLSTDNEQSARDASDRLQQFAADIRLNLGKDGVTYSIEGVPFTAGIGHDAESADTDLSANKGDYDRNALPDSIRRADQGNVGSGNEAAGDGRNAAERDVQGPADPLTLTDNTVVTPPRAQRPASQSGLFGPVTDIDRQRLRFERDKPKPEKTDTVDIEDAINQTPPTGGVSVSTPTEGDRNAQKPDVDTSATRNAEADGQANPASSAQADAGADNGAPPADAAGGLTTNAAARLSGGGVASKALLALSNLSNGTYRYGDGFKAAIGATKAGDYQGALSALDAHVAVATDGSKMSRPFDGGINAQIRATLNRWVNEARWHLLRLVEQKTPEDFIAAERAAMGIVDAAASEAAASPENDKPEPTEAQKEAGNYAKGHVRVHGLDFAIETPAGTSRRPEWPPLANHYGYIKRTEGADGEHVDVFFGPRAEDETAPVFVVDQFDPKSGKFDEHKVMLGFSNELQARTAYLANYAPGWKGMKSVTRMSIDDFKSWLRDGDLKQPVDDIPKPAAPIKYGNRQVPAKAAAPDLITLQHGAETVRVLRSEWEGSAPKLNTYTKNDKPSMGWAERANLSEKPAAPAATAPAKIDDFGEKIGGAKKDTWGGFKDKLREVSDDNILTEPLSKTWPQPDYQKMVDEGADSWVVAFMRAARDEIPRKPTATWKQKTWAAQVKLLRGVSLQLLNGTISVETAKANMAAMMSRGMREIASRVELYQLVGHAQSLVGVSFNEHHYSMYKGRNNVHLWVVEKETAATAFSNWPRELATGDTKEQMLQAFKEKIGSMEINPEKAQETAFDVYSRRGIDGFLIGKKVGRNHIDLAGPFKTVGEARDYRKANSAALIAKLEASKEIPKERRDTNEPRVGEDMRNGQDVTPTMFGEAFGFKGVEFGNWVEQKKRQADLNDAFDALMDMAAVLGIPPKAISLNGELGLAFGARGGGGTTAAAAHYEPGKVVINLTKKEGAGSLGHEWWHALDNYFQRMRGKKEYATESLDVSLASRGSKFVEDAKMRKEMVIAFGAVVSAIQSTAIKARSSKLDAKRTKEYWTTGREMAARAFESYLISKLQDQDASNDYLANIVDEDTWAAAEKLGFELDASYPYPTAGEIPAIRAGFDKFFQTVEAREGDDGRVEIREDRAQYSGHAADVPNAVREDRAKAGRGRVRGDVQPAAGVPAQLDIFDVRPAERKPTLRERSDLLRKSVDVRTGTLRSGIERVTSLADAAHIFAPLRKYPVEQFMALVMDKDGKPLRVLRHSIGTIDGAGVYPEVLIPQIAAVEGAAKVAFAHNHPSGNMTASAADLMVTTKLTDALDGLGVEYIGHVIVAPGSKRATMVGSGETPITPARRSGEVPVTERQLRKNQEPRFKFRDPSMAADYVALHPGGAVLMLNSQHGLVGRIPMDESEMLALRGEDSDGQTRARALVTAIADTSAAAFIVVADSEKSGMNVSRFLGSKGRVLDVFVPDGNRLMSLAARGNNIYSGGYFTSSPAGWSIAETGTDRLSDEVIEREVAKARAAFPGFTITVLDSIQDSPASAATKAKYPGANGLTDGVSRVWIFRNAQSLQALRMTLAHEITGHIGVESVIGSDWPAVQAEIERIRKGASMVSPALANAVKAAVSRYPKADPLTFARESVAIMAETGVTGSLWDRIVAAVRKYLRKVFGSLQWNENEIRDLLRRAGDSVRSKPAVFRGAEFEAAQVVFHGTPHKVDRFRMDKIGTGEGNQSYGWGAYFASRREVAETYKKALEKREYDIDDPAGIDASFWMQGVTRQQAIQNVESALANPPRSANAKVIADWKSDLAYLKGDKPIPQITARHGNLYSVNIPEDSDLLDWDKPLSEQPEKVQDAIDTVLRERYSPDMVEVYEQGWSEILGKHFYKDLAAEVLGGPDAAKRASEALNAAGIPGLRYLDGDSRANGEGSHNYVIWSEEAIGEPGMASNPAPGPIERQMHENARAGQPIDKIFRAIPQALGMLDAQGRLKLGTKAFDALVRVLAEKRPDPDGPFGWAASTIETIRSGLIDRYGVPSEFLKRDQQRESEVRSVLMHAARVSAELEGLTTAEAKVLQAMLTGQEIPAGELGKLSQPIKEAIDQMGREAVEMGLISPEAYARNHGAYLHRSYLKYEADRSKLGKFIGNLMDKRRKKLMGDTLRGRGMTMERDAETIATALGGSLAEGDIVTVLRQKTEKGVRTKYQRGPLNGAPPVGWESLGDWRVMKAVGKKAKLWRDFTPAEREKMGEILDARYNIVKTFSLMAHDLATGRFLKDIAANPEWATKDLSEGSVAAEAGGRYQTYSDSDWVRVPDAGIPGTNDGKGKPVKRWGALAGMYVRAPIWRDLNQLQEMQNPQLWGSTWQDILRVWKMNKTARNPVVHMNNVMSNLVFMDLADIRLRDLYAAIGAYRRGEADADYRDAMAHGAFGGGFADQELKRKVLDPILDKILKEQRRDQPDDTAGKLGVLKALGGIWDVVKRADGKMLDAYNGEDEIFRLAFYLRRQSLGDTPQEAARAARRQFIDYDIRAPWVNMARNTLLPFIGYTYRSIPLLAQAIAERPWKLAKYATLAAVANWFGYWLGDEEDEEETDRKVMAPQVQGNTWTGSPRMMRMPWHDADGNPVFLDVRRWVPAGDVFDTNQSEIGMPAWLQFGGPLMLAGEYALNKQAFTRKPITDPLTDTTTEKAGKVASWAWKSFMPNAPWIPESYSWDKLQQAATGATDDLGRDYSVLEASSSVLGIKAAGHDVGLQRRYRAMDFDRVERELDFDASLLKREMTRKAISRERFDAGMAVIIEKKKRLNDERKRVLSR